MGQETLEISEPIVPLLETIVSDTQSSYAKMLTTHVTVITTTFLMPCSLSISIDFRNAI